MPDAEKPAAPEESRDQTTRPALRKGRAPIRPSGSARQPQYDRRTTPDAASGDPTE